MPSTARRSAVTSSWTGAKRPDRKGSVAGSTGVSVSAMGLRSGVERSAEANDVSSPAGGAGIGVERRRAGPRVGPHVARRGGESVVRGPDRARRRLAVGGGRDRVGVVGPTASASPPCCASLGRRRRTRRRAGRAGSGVADRRVTSPRSPMPGPARRCSRTWPAAPAWPGRATSSTGCTEALSARAGVGRRLHRGARALPRPGWRRPRLPGRARCAPPSACRRDRLGRARSRTLSGGEAARAALAAILLAAVDVLLLDEPTNNLDFAGLDRLEPFVDGAAGRGGGRVARPGLPRPRPSTASSRSTSDATGPSSSPAAGPTTSAAGTWPARQQYEATGST